MRNLKWIIAYDGSNYLGWQKTAMGPSIEAELEAALSRILRHPIELQAASRTDAGVHAEGQVVNCLTQNPIELWKLLRGANSLLPEDIRVKSVEETSSQFHPTLDAKEKVYFYRISTGSYQLPQQRHMAWHCPYTLDLEAMRREASHLVGKHDFSALSGSSGVRHLKELTVTEWEGGPCLRMVADRFLYRMARTIAGTLVDVGRGRISSLESIMQSGKRALAGVTAPARGLALQEVVY